MTEEQLFRRKGAFQVTAAQAIESEILRGVRNSYFEWIAGSRYGGRWSSVLQESSASMGRGHRIGLEIDGEAIELRENQIRFFLQPAVSKRVELGSSSMPPAVAAAIKRYRESTGGRTPWAQPSAADSDQSVWLEVFVLETGRSYHARCREVRYPLPPGFLGRPRHGRHWVLEISDRPFSELGENPKGTPRSESIVY
jgi:hypothetical protein